MTLRKVGLKKQAAGQTRPALRKSGIKRQRLTAKQRAKDPYLEPRTPIRRVNPKRRKSEFARCYGSKERVEFVRGRSCAVEGPGCQGWIENAHIRTDGMGRKASSVEIAPLCAFHHRTLHALGRWAFEAEYNVDLQVVAEQTEAEWQLQ